MTIENLILFLIKFGYIMVFGVLGITTLMLHIPKEKGIENYKKARTTIGFSLFAIVLYCAICFAFSQVNALEHVHDRLEILVKMPFA